MIFDLTILSNLVAYIYTYGYVQVVTCPQYVSRKCRVNVWTGWICAGKPELFAKICVSWSFFLTKLGRRIVLSVTCVLMQFPFGRQKLPINRISNSVANSTARFVNFLCFGWLVLFDGCFLLFLYYASNSSSILCMGESILRQDMAKLKTRKAQNEWRTSGWWLKSHLEHINHNPLSLTSSGFGRLGCTVCPAKPFVLDGGVLGSTKRPTDHWMLGSEVYRIDDWGR